MLDHRALRPSPRDSTQCLQCQTLLEGVRTVDRRDSDPIAVCHSCHKEMRRILKMSSENEIHSRNPSPPPTCTPPPTPPPVAPSAWHQSLLTKALDELAALKFELHSLHQRQHEQKRYRLAVESSNAALLRKLKLVREESAATHFQLALHRNSRAKYVAEIEVLTAQVAALTDELNDTKASHMTFAKATAGIMATLRGELKDLQRRYKSLVNAVGPMRRGGTRSATKARCA